VLPACGLAFGAFLLYVWLISTRQNAIPKRTSLGVGCFNVIAAIFATVAFIVDAVIVKIAKDAIDDSDVTVHYGNGVGACLHSYFP
jgi:hypothetical protein